MKQRRLICLLLACSLLLSGCVYNANRLADIGIVKGVAFDTGENGKKYNMTACMLRSAEDDGGYINYSAMGSTLAELRAGISNMSERSPFLGQNDIIAVSEELAKKDFAGVVQAFFASQEKYGTEQIAIIEGASAADVLSYENGFSQPPPVSLLLLIKNAATHSFAVKTNVKNVQNGLKGIGNTALVPVCRLEGEGEDARLTVSGMGVVKGKVLTGILQPEEAMGVKWISGDMEDTFHTIYVPELQEDFGVEIVEAETNVTAEKKDGKLHFSIAIQFYFSISEQSGSSNTLAEQNQTYILQAAEAQAEEQAMMAIDKMKEWKADFLNLAAVYLNRHPEEMEKYEYIWGDTLSESAYSVEAKSALRFQGTPEKSEYLWE